VGNAGNDRCRLDAYHGPMAGSSVAPYEDIPGTFVFDGTRSRQGYWLNQFCMSLRHERNRDAFRADEQAYLDRYPMSADQRQSVLDRAWLHMLELGGNIYYTFKLAACDGLTFQQLAAKQTGVSEEEYVAMMLAGGRSIEGNRSKSDRPIGAEVAAHG
jgi:protocatechuate 4,5-dioxygenase, alpha chain